MRCLSNLCKKLGTASILIPVPLLPRFPDSMSSGLSLRGDDVAVKKNEERSFIDKSFIFQTANQQFQSGFIDFVGSGTVVTLNFCKFDGCSIQPTSL